MTDSLRTKCELFERNRSAISKKFIFEKDLMNIAAGLVFTGADKEADIDKLIECRSILKKHTGFFSEYRETVKLALLSEMALTGDPEQYIEDVKDVYKKLHKGHFRDNSYMVLAAMLLCDFGRQNDADAIIEKHNEILQRMNKLHPVLTDSADISYVILLALSDRSVDTIIEDMTTCLDYLKKELKIKIGSDSIQGLSEILALTDGDIREKCDSVLQLYNILKENKAEIDGSAFSVLAMLIGTDETPEAIVGEIKEADEFLKSCKLFKDKESENKGNRLMFAELLVASSYGIGSPMINNAFVNTALSVIKAQQIAAMISVFSNVLAGILGAVADKNSSETSDDESAQSESNGSDA